MHPLFSVDAVKVDRALLEDFLSLGIAEGLTVEYKADMDALEEVGVSCSGTPTAARFDCGSEP